MPCTVVFLGGSITAGAGASSYEKCYVGRMSAWLEKNYPETKFTFVNSGIGATGSSLGVYRCERDVTAYKPDLLVYEFAVNDQDFDFIEVGKNTEAIYRKLWKVNPYADILNLYNMTMWMSDILDAGGVLPARTAQIACACYYGGIPHCNVGEAIRAKTINESWDWNQFQYTKDCTHPNDAGYEVIDGIVTKTLAEAFAGCTGETQTPRTLPPRLFSEHPLDNAHIEDSFNADYTGWEKIDKSLGAYPHYIESDKPGTSLTYTFHGSRMSLFAQMGKDSGDLIVTVDGGAPFTRSLWDVHCPYFDRTTEVSLVRDLDEGEHTVTITVSEDKAEGSQGHMIRIAAFLIA